MTASTFGCACGGAHVDADDPGVGDRRPQDRQVQHPGQLDVVAVLAHPAHEARVLLAEHAAVADGLLVVVVEARRAGRVSMVVMTHPRRRSTGCSFCDCGGRDCTDRTIVA